MTILCAASAHAQTYTWLSTATGTVFNDANNWSPGFTLPTTGTLFLATGTSGTANRPTVTASATAGGLTFGIGGNGNSFALNSSDPAAVLSLTGTQPIFASISGTGAIGTNIQFLSTGTQSIFSNSNLTLSGTLSGGDTNGRLLFNSGWGLTYAIPNPANTFASRVAFEAQYNNGWRNPAVPVPLIGMAGSPSSLGTSGTVQLGGSAYITLTSTAAAQTTDKAFELYLPVTTAAGDFGINSGVDEGVLPSRPMLNITGPIRTLPVSGTTMTTPSLIRFLNSGTVSGLISEDASHPLRVLSRGAVLTNTNNSYSGGFTAFDGTFIVPSIGMAGTPSVFGTGSITLRASAPIFRYTGAGETTNRNFRLEGSSLAPPRLEASGSGPLVLSSGTLSISSSLVLLGGTTSGRITSNIVSGAASTIRKVDAGTWTLTGTNVTSVISGADGTLILGARAALQGGTAANWTKANIFTFSNGVNPVLGFAVGGANDFTASDVTTLITNLSGDVSAGGMRQTASWGFDTTNSGTTFTVADVIADTNNSGTTPPTYGQGGRIGLVKLGSGTLVLSNTNTYTYGTRIEGGVLAITNTAALGSGTGYLNFAGGTLDMGTLTLARSGVMTFSAGGLANGVLDGTFGLTKTGTGTFRITTGSNTFTGATAIQNGVVEVASVAGPGAASSLGAPLLASSTIALGNATTGGTFRYIGDTSGTMTRTLNLAGSAGGSAGIEASGLGALVVPSNALTIAAGAKTLTLGGSGTAANTIGAIPDASGSVLTVVKDGPGLWTLSAANSFTGQFSVRNGTVVATVNANQTTGAFGAASPILTVLVGDSSAGASGTAAVLMAAGRTTNKVMDVQTGGGSQAVMLGSQGTGAAAEFANDLWLGRPVTLMAATGGTATFSGAWRAAGNSGTAAAVNVSIGANGSTGTVRLSSSVMTTGSVGVRFGTLDIADSRTLAAAGIVGIDSGATLAGSGSVLATLGGAGFVAPGNSPGILTAQAVDPTGGLDFNFEFSGTAPTYGTGTASVNDVLRLTGSTPFTAALTTSNTVSIYLSGTGNVNDVFQGGFFINSGTAAIGNFASLVTNPTVVAYYPKAGGAFSYNGQSYALLSDIGQSLQMGVATVPTASFADGTVNGGQVTTFTVAVVVPEPGTLALAALGLGLAGYALRRRRAA